MTDKTVINTESTVRGLKDDAIDEFCLAYIFQPIIQANLDDFCHNYWNTHHIARRGIPEHNFLPQLVLPPDHDDGGGGALFLQKSTSPFPALTRGD